MRVTNSKADRIVSGRVPISRWNIRERLGVRAENGREGEEEDGDGRLSMQRNWIGVGKC